MSLEALPEAVLSFLGSFLSSSALCSISGVCKSLCRVFNNQEFWERKYIKEWPGHPVPFMKTDCPNPRSWKCRWFAKYRIEENWEGNSYVYKKFTLFDPGFKRCAGKSTPKVTLSMAYNREPGLLAVAVAKMELMIFSFESISTAPKLLRVHPLEKAKEVVSIHRYFPHEPCINLMWNGDILGCHCLMQERNNSPDPRDCYSLPSSAIADGAVHYFYGWNSKKLLWKHTWDSPDKKTPLCSTPWGFIISGFFGKKQHPELRLYNTGGSLVKSPLELHQVLSSVIYSENRVFSVEGGGTIRIWDATAPTHFHQISVVETRTSQIPIEIAVRGVCCVTISDLNEITTTNLSSGEVANCAPVEFHSGLGINSRGFMVISCKVGHCPFFYDGRRGKNTVILGYPEELVSLYLDDSLAISLSYDAALHVWDWDHCWGSHRPVRVLPDYEDPHIYGPRFAHCTLKFSRQLRPGGITHNILPGFSVIPKELNMPWMHITSVTPGGPAENGGLKCNDLVLRIDEIDYVEACSDSSDFFPFIRNFLNNAATARATLHFAVREAEPHSPIRSVDVIPQPGTAWRGVLGLQATRCECAPLRYLLHYRGLTPSAVDLQTQQDRIEDDLQWKRSGGGFHLDAHYSDDL